MSFNLVTVILLIIATAFILLGFKALFKGGWIPGFLRGLAGFGLLIVAIIISLSAVNLAGYNELHEGKVIANVSFKQVDAQVFDVTVTNPENGIHHNFTIDGDMWSINTRDISLRLGGGHFYKVDNLQGRFYALEQQLRAGLNRHSFPSEELGLDLWLLSYQKSSSLVNAKLDSTAFIPMVNDALFSVSSGNLGLEVKPLNPTANQAISQ